MSSDWFIWNYAKMRQAAFLDDAERRRLIRTATHRGQRRGHVSLFMNRAGVVLIRAGRRLCAASDAMDASPGRCADGPC